MYVLCSVLFTYSVHSELECTSGPNMRMECLFAMIYLLNTGSKILYKTGITLHMFRIRPSI